jgi:hypothetical protein
MRKYLHQTELHKNPEPVQEESYYEGADDEEIKIEALEDYAK